MEEKLYFTPEEVDCNCGCCYTLGITPFYHKVNTLRGIVGHPLHPTSWCRCPVHNLSVGGLSTSSHLKGEAVDLATPTEYIKCRILLAAGAVGFRGVGVGKNFIHLDNDPLKASNRFWLY